MNVLTPQGVKLLRQWPNFGLISKFYLAGGTALALQYNHRHSVDFDWFNQLTFSNLRLKAEMSKLKSLKINSEAKGTLYATVAGVKVSFLHYPYRLLYPLINYQHIKLADPRDIAAMKLQAISSRGARKDFIDLFFLLKNYSLSELLNFFKRKYVPIEYNRLHLLKSLLYFEDADQEPEPIMIKKVSWREVKQEIIKQVNNNW